VGAEERTTSLVRNIWQFSTSLLAQEQNVSPTKVLLLCCQIALVHEELFSNCGSRTVEVCPKTE